jgi:hypothetical protein
MISEMFEMGFPLIELY